MKTLIVKIVAAIRIFLRRLICLYYKAEICHGKDFTLRYPNSIVHPEKIIIGDSVFINAGLTALAYGGVEIASGTLIAPNVSLLSSGHDPDKSGLDQQSSVVMQQIVIGRNCWIGASAILLPGVTIGENTVIGAGSIVTKNIPPNVIAAGNPCKVIRSKKL